jgi:hypothetical protein
MFGAVVLALVGIAVVGPKIFAGKAGPTADDVYLDSLPSRYEKTIKVPAVRESVATPNQQFEAPTGAPRAASPARQPVPSSPPTPPAATAGLAPLRVPSE